MVLTHTEDTRKARFREETDQVLEAGGRREREREISVPIQGHGYIWQCFAVGFSFFRFTSM